MKEVLNMKVGYIRISTVDQNTARQYELMKEKGIEKYFEDKCSGKNTNRKALNELMEFIREGDVVYIEKGLPHQLTALSPNSIVMEVSTEHFDDDSYRIYKNEPKDLE